MAPPWKLIVGLVLLLIGLAVGRQRKTKMTDRRQEYQDQIYRLFDEWSVDTSAFWANHPDIGHERWGLTNDPEQKSLHAAIDAIEGIARHVLKNSGYNYNHTDEETATRPGIRIYKRS